MAVVTGLGTLTSSFTEVVSSGVVTPQNIPASITLSTQYKNGTAAGQIDLIYAKQLSLVASTPQTLDLTALTDLGGASINFARVRELVVQVVDTTAGHNVTLGDAAANAWAPFWGATGTDIVYAGSIRYFTDPTSTGAGVGAVVSGTSKDLKIDPGTNNIVINILIAGCSAA